MVREGLRLLKEREEFKQVRLNELRREIQEGVAAAGRGELVDGSDALHRIRARRGSTVRR